MCQQQKVSLLLPSYRQLHWRKMGKNRPQLQPPAGAACRMGQHLRLGRQQWMSNNQSWSEPAAKQKRLLLCLLLDPWQMVSPQ
jgi:hypothetical protein